MEVVEVNDFPCHSDGEEVVLLDLDKANNAEDLTDEHKMIVEESADVHEMVVDDSTDVHEGVTEGPGQVHEVVAKNSGNVHEAVADSAKVLRKVVTGTSTEVPQEVATGSSAKVLEVAAEGSSEVLQVMVLNNIKIEPNDESTEDIDVMETSDEVSSQVGQIVITNTPIKSEVTCDLKNSVEISLCDNGVVNDSNDSKSSEMSTTMTIDIMEEVTEVVDKEECLEECIYIDDEQEIEVEVVDHVNTSNEIEYIDSNINESVNSKVEKTEELTNSSSKTVEMIDVKGETKNPDGSLVLKKDKITVTIPQHIAGRDISTLNEETLPRSGKRMLKPRFGVKVPYIHMTSQIVTQDEIAKELFERFQQKYPLTRVDKQDNVFSMKLSQRLANTLSSKTSDKNSKKNIKTKKKPEVIKSSIKPTNKPLNTTISVENTPIQIQNLEIEFSNNISNDCIEINDSQHIDQITNTLQSLGQSADQLIKSEDKNDEKISSNEELIAILEDFENIETPETISINTVPISNNTSVPEAIPIPKPVFKKKMIRSTTRTKRSKPRLDPEIEKQIALKQLQEVSRPKRFDSHYAKRKAETDKKLLVKNDLGSAQKRKKPTPDDVPEVKIAIDQYIKSYTDKRQSTVVKVEDVGNDESVNDNLIEVVEPKTEIKTNNDAKARTMREINRLLGDEGAINMIYSLEKRRSPGNNNTKNVLPSTRRKKKDLMLKTKLVKNAMLKMSSPAGSSMMINRLGRRSDVCTPTVSSENENKCIRKTSIDSQGSDQSMKCLGNFPGRKTIPADESKIIRKHSTSSEASSVGEDVPILPVPDAEPVNDTNTKHTPVKALRVYTRKTKNSGDLSLNSNDKSFDEVSKETNKSFVETKKIVGQKVKKQPVQVSKSPSK